MATRRPRKPHPPASDLSADELELFAREVANAKPLSRDAKERVRVLPHAGASPSKPPAQVGMEPPRFPGPSLAEGSSGESPEALDSYAAPGVDRRELRKLKRGNYAPELRLDLHGLMAVEAVARVKRVLDLGPARRPRCICVVHGRGLGSAGNIAVLKPRVREYLRTHPAVLAFTDAPRGDGGAGAVYVLLRR